MVGPEKPEVIRVTVEFTSTVRTGEVFSTTINHSHDLMSETNSMVPANSLKVNDNIQTIYGRAVVRSLEHLDYDKDMYQFFSASKKFVDNVVSELNEEELFRHLSNSMLGLTPHDHLAFVDGILSSDWIIQHELENKISRGISLTEIR